VQTRIRTRIELNPDSPPLLLAGHVLHELCQHALEARPEECCGLLSGPWSERAHERFRRVHRCRNDMTRRHRNDPQTYPRDGREAFYMNEIDLLRARDRAEEAGEQVTGVYHSHVGAGTYLSEMDRDFIEQELFPFPAAAHFVIAVWGPQTRVGVFERDGRTGAWAGRPVGASPR